MKRKGKMRNVILSMFILASFYAVSPCQAYDAIPLEVDVWLDRGDGGVYNSDDAMIVYFEVNRPSYVTVYNIDTEGYVRILYPYYPGMDNYVAGHEIYSVPGSGFEMALYVDEPIGMGYIEAVASERPFHLDEWSFMSQSYEPVEGVELMRRIIDDPFLSMVEINHEILSFPDELIYDDDFVVYYVEEIPYEPTYISSDFYVGSYYYDAYCYSYPSYYAGAYNYWYCDDFWYWGYYYPLVYYYPYAYYGHYAYYGPYDYYAHYDHHPYSYRGEPRYSRKYDYTTRDDGHYRSKGETPRTVNAVRSGDYEEKNGSRYVSSQAVRENDGGSRSYPSFQEKVTIGDTPHGNAKRVEPTVVKEVREDRPGDEIVTRKAGDPASSVFETRQRASRKAPSNYESSVRQVSRVEKKREGADRPAQQHESRVRSTGSVSHDRGERNPVVRRSTVVSEGQARRETRSVVNRGAVRSGNERTQSNRGSTVRNETRSRSERPAVRETRRNGSTNSPGGSRSGAGVRGSGSRSRGVSRSGGIVR